MQWFVVLARYPLDEAIQRAGERAEVLFLRGCAYCAAAESDGRIPDTQLTQFGLRGVHTRAAALTREGLWVRVDGGYDVPNWRVIQFAAYAAEQKRRRDRNRQAAARAEPEACTGQHENCRGCGTTRRLAAKAKRNAKPDWCGDCNETTRMVGYDTDHPGRCPACHPLRVVTPPSIMQLDAG